MEHDLRQPPPALNGQRKRARTTVEEATGSFSCATIRAYTDAVLARRVQSRRRERKRAPGADLLARARSLFFIVHPRRFMLIQRETSRADDISEMAEECRDVSRAICHPWLLSCAIVLGIFLSLLPARKLPLVTSGLPFPRCGLRRFRKLGCVLKRKVVNLCN